MSIRQNWYRKSKPIGDLWENRFEVMINNLGHSMITTKRVTKNKDIYHHVDFEVYNNKELWIRVDVKSPKKIRRKDKTTQFCLVRN